MKPSTKLAGKRIQRSRSSRAATARSFFTSAPPSTAASAARVPATDAKICSSERPRSALRASSLPARARRPPCRIATWSAMPSIARRSWVVTKTVVPRSARSPITSRKTASRATTSRPSVGSSRRSSSGAWPSARASMTAPFWPFESRPNARSAGTSKRRNRSATAGASQRAWSRPQRAERARGVISGGASGSSGTTPTRAMRLVRCVHGSSPSRRTRPRAGGRWPRSTRRSEDLPAPLRPRRAKTEPRGTARVSPSITRVRPYLTESPSISRAGPAAAAAVVSALIACLPSTSARLPARPSAGPR